jgi:hypothetical protein
MVTSECVVIVIAPRRVLIKQIQFRTFHQTIDSILVQQ